MPPAVISPLEPPPAPAASAPRIVTLADRPDLLPTIVQWLRDHHAPQAPLAPYAAQIASRVSLLGPEQCLILLAGSVPAGTASLTAQGLKSRSELTPWLTNVFVASSFRGRGYARRLVMAVEAAARRAAIPTLWLYTRSAEPLYGALGWRWAGADTHDGAPVTLMRRDLVDDDR
ncbi:MAG TPA: GNAT family N-acetyltransferase [Acetobacteraceae bacterium]|nr:GNAT family N-acetyltransferase [Acetobacteraceae bacterium]